ncbi:MAG: hypothetical protein ACK5M3_07045 [Dysgonomonas sp.]
MRLLLFVLLISFSTYISAIETKLASDTVILYEMEGLSSEGAEAVVYYKASGNIDSARISIYGSSGQVQIEMSFSKAQIKVIERSYFYRQPLSEIKVEEDIYFKSEIEYLIDYNGNILNKKSGVEYINIFMDFKRLVPFKIKYPFQILKGVSLFSEKNCFISASLAT